MNCSYVLEIDENRRKFTCDKLASVFEYFRVFLFVAIPQYRKYRATSLLTLPELRLE